MALAAPVADYVSAHEQCPHRDAIAKDPAFLRRVAADRRVLRGNHSTGTALRLVVPAQAQVRRRARRTVGRRRARRTANRSADVADGPPALHRFDGASTAASSPCVA